jgi:hypothetical protein
VSVDQNSATSGLMFVARPDDGMPARGNQLCLQTNARELVYEPLCAVLQFFLVLIVSRNTRKAEERIIFLKVVVTHGHKLIGFGSLPTISAGIGRERNTELKLVRALFQLPEIREPSRG